MFRNSGHVESPIPAVVKRAGPKYTIMLSLRFM